MEGATHYRVYRGTSASGPLYYSNASWVNAQLVKTGVGTVTHLAVNTVTNYPLHAWM